MIDYDVIYENRDCIKNLLTKIIQGIVKLLLLNFNSIFWFFLPIAKMCICMKVDQWKNQIKLFLQGAELLFKFLVSSLYDSSF